MWNEVKRQGARIIEICAAAIFGGFFIPVVILPSPAGFIILAVAAATAVGFSWLFEIKTHDAGYADGQRCDPPRAPPTQNLRPHRVLPSTILDEHESMRSFLRDAFTALEQAIEHSQLASDGLIGVDQHVSAVRAENARLHEETSALDQIGGILAAARAPTRRAPAPVPEGAPPSAYAPPAPQALAPKRQVMDPVKSPLQLEDELGELLRGSRGRSEGEDPVPTFLTKPSPA